MTSRFLVKHPFSSPSSPPTQRRGGGLLLHLGSNLIGPGGREADDSLRDIRMRGNLPTIPVFLFSFPFPVPAIRHRDYARS